jgi:hypothetical protein
VAVEHSAIGHALRNSLWLFPAVETLHILGFALLVGAIVTFDVRVIGARDSFVLEAWQRAVLPVARLGFLIAVPMGLMLFTTEATAYSRNPAFRLKLVMLAVALVNIVIFHRLARGRATLSTGLRIAAGLSLASWVLVLVLGRLIAYV